MTGTKHTTNELIEFLDEQIANNERELDDWMCEEELRDGIAKLKRIREILEEWEGMKKKEYDNFLEGIHK